MCRSDSNPGRWSHYLERWFTYHMTHAFEIYNSVGASIFTLLWNSVTISFNTFYHSKASVPISNHSHFLSIPQPSPSSKPWSSFYSSSAYSRYVLSITVHVGSHVSYLSTTQLICRLFHILFLCPVGWHFECVWTNLCVANTLHSPRDKPGVELFSSVYVYSLEAQRDYLPK